MTVRWKRLSLLLAIAAVVAVVAWVMTNNTRSVTAIQGTICGEFNLPDGAEGHQLGIREDPNGKKIIILEYQSPSGPGTLTIPFDTIAATCLHPLIRAVVARAQETDRQTTQESCKFVEDLMAGRVEAPPGYNRAYAEQWYRKGVSAPGDFLSRTLDKEDRACKLVDYLDSRFLP